MDLREHLKALKKYPIVFTGSGLSMRYLETPNWEELVIKLYSMCGKNQDNYYTDRNILSMENPEITWFDITASLISKLEREYEELNLHLDSEPHLRVRSIISREGYKSKIKVLISELFNEYVDYLGDEQELMYLRESSQKTYCYITTNYDEFLELNVKGFNVVVGNNIYFSDPTQSIYKIHGSLTNPDTLILTKNDYDDFEKSNILIRSQLISLFLHHPIIFMGYSLTDKNILNLIKDIFKYIDKNSNEGKALVNNFIFIEREKEKMTTDIEDYSVTLSDGTFITIKKIRTDNFSEIFQSISSINVPITIGELKRVKNIIKKIEISEEEIPIRLASDISEFKDHELVMTLAPTKNITFSIMRANEVIQGYFKKIQISSDDIVKNIDKLTINRTMYFPIARIIVFTSIEVLRENVVRIEQLLTQQQERINTYIYRMSSNLKHKKYYKVRDVVEDSNVSESNKNLVIFYNVLEGNINLEKFKTYVKAIHGKIDTKNICLIDYLDYYEDALKKVLELNEDSML